MEHQQQSHHHCRITATSASCCLTPYSYYHHFSFPSLTPKGVSCFPWFHKSSAAFGISLLPLLNDEDRLFWRSRAARLSWHPQHNTSPLAEDPSPRKPAFSQKSCYSRHFTLIQPTCQHTCLGFERTAIAMACSILRRDTWKGEEKDLVLRRLRLTTGCRNYPV